MSYIYEMEDGQIAVVTPYHPEIVAGCKRLMGRFQETHIPCEGFFKAWILRAEHRPAVEALVRRVFPPDNEKLEKIVTFHSDEKQRTAPMIDGRALYTFTRDGLGRINHPDVVEVIDLQRYHGGSARYPLTWGHVKVRVRVRPDAEFEWDDTTVEIEPVNVDGAHSEERRALLARIESLRAELSMAEQELAQLPEQTPVS